MTIEQINTGSELMLGRVLNTHSQWICRQLADAGFEVNRQTAIPDTGPAIQQAVREALGRTDFIIVTGGLGPTTDDLTRDLIAELLGKPLRVDEAILKGLQEFFAKRGRAMPQRTELQAQVPAGALILDNPNGTAPGLAMHVDPNPFRPDGRPSWLVMLPGPPREMRPMFTNHALPLLRKEYPLESAFSAQTFRTTGMGESVVEETIAGAMQPLVEAGLEIGYCAHYGAVDVRLGARGTGAGDLLERGRDILQQQLGHHIFGTGDDQLHAIVIQLLTQRRETLAVAESCTGGYVCNLLTNVPGASTAFVCGAITYSDAAKQQLLGVRPETLAEYGAVSEATAREMAKGARTRFCTDYALAITGIAGPGGGTPAKPVGTVFIALSSARHTWVLNPINRFDRETFKQVTCQQALEILRRQLIAT